MPKPTDQMQMVLDTLTDMAPLPIETLSAEIARQMPSLSRAAVAVYGHHFSLRAIASLPLPVAQVQHYPIAGEGGEFIARIYTPHGNQPAEGWPALLYFHGGGWVLGTLDRYDATCRALCEATSAVIISVHTRQAPEHPWPAPPQDAFAAYQWVGTHAHDLNIDSHRIAIGGESAGGNLAAVITLKARDSGLPMPVHQLLIYPVTDLLNGMNSQSAKAHANAKPLNRAMMEWFYRHYVPQGEDRRNPAISPLYAADLRGLPPTTMILAEIDPLRSDGEAYAARLRDAGVPVSMHLYKGVTHEFFGLKGIVHEAGEAIAQAANDLQTSFKQPARLRQAELETA